MRALNLREIETVSGGLRDLGSININRPEPSFPQTSQPGGPLFPTSLSDMSASQIACQVASTTLGLSDVARDIACHTDTSGDNPKDPANADRLGDIAQKIGEDVSKIILDTAAKISDAGGDWNSSTDTWQQCDDSGYSSGGGDGGGGSGGRDEDTFTELC